MSDRRVMEPEGLVFEADNFFRCALCQAWFDRSNPMALASTEVRCRIRWQTPEQLGRTKTTNLRIGVNPGATTYRLSR